MAISTHPYITGVPHRIKYYDMIFNYIRQFAGVVFMTGSEFLTGTLALPSVTFRQCPCRAEARRQDSFMRTIWHKNKSFPRAKRARHLRRGA